MMRFRMPRPFGSFRDSHDRRLARSVLLAEAAARQTGPVPDLDKAASVVTEWGPLFIDADDDVIRPAIGQHGVWEPGETALLLQWLAPGMTFIDIGAHVGYYTLLGARRVGPSGLVLAFEPGPRNYELLLANVWRNGFTNVVCFPWAVSDHVGFLDLFLDDRNTGDNRTFPSPGRRCARVRAVALDALPSIRPPIDVVKIDVQGSEDAVIAGMGDLLARSPAARVTLEYWPFGLRARGRDERATLRYYRSLGYWVRVQNPERPGIEELTDDEILAYCAAYDGVLHTNLVLTRA
jgi:FkbM family methyltransferase